MIPNNIPDQDFERGVMSCVFRDFNWPAAYLSASKFISDKHFSDTDMGKVWRVMGECDAQPDELTMADKAGVDLGIIVGWTSATETSAQVHYYSEGVLKAWTKRQAQAISHQIQDGISGGEDPKVTLSSAGKTISDALSDQGSSFESVDEGMDEVLEHCMELDAGNVDYLKTGLVDLDKVLGGFKPGEMSIIAARPSNGKTSLALSIAALMAKAGKKVLFSSLEMSKHQLLKRLIHMEARVPIINNKHHYNANDRVRLREVAEEIKAWPLKIDQASGITVPYLSAKAMSEKHKWGLDVLIVDYLGIMSSEGRDTVERISNVSRGLQMLAKSLDAPVLALSQQNRESEKENVPKMSHLRDSGSIEQDADQIIMLKRVEEGAFQQTEAMEAYVVKNRNGGTGKVPLTFSRRFARFDNYATEPKTHLS